jgi:hypothetical protein
MADKSLFSRLKRLFSTDVIIRNAGGNQLKVFDVNKAQQTGDLETNALVDRFNRIYTNSGTSFMGNKLHLTTRLCVLYYIQIMMQWIWMLL